MKDLNSHKLKFSPYLEKLYQSDKPLIIYKVKDGYNLYTDFSKKIVLTNHNVDKFFNIFLIKKLKKKQIFILVFLVMKSYATYLKSKLKIKKKLIFIREFFINPRH